MFIMARLNGRTPGRAVAAYVDDGALMPCDGTMNDQLIADEDDIQHAARCLKAMSHPLRLKILCILGRGAASVQEIVDQVGTTQSNVSQHLAILREKGLLAFDKDANRVFYRIDDPNTLQLIEKIREVFCHHRAGTPSRP